MRLLQSHIKSFFCSFVLFQFFWSFSSHIIPFYPKTTDLKPQGGSNAELRVFRYTYSSPWSPSHGRAHLWGWFHSPQNLVLLRNSPSSWIEVFLFLIFPRSSREVGSLRVQLLWAKDGKYSSLLLTESSSQEFSYLNHPFSRTYLRTSGQSQN